MPTIPTPNIANMAHRADMSLYGTHTLMALLGKLLGANFWIVFYLPFNPCIKIIIYAPIRLSATLGAILSATKPFYDPHNI